MGFVARSSLQTDNHWKHESIFRSTFSHRANLQVQNVPLEAALREKPLTQGLFSRVGW